jgi:DNA polymerase-1
VAAISGDPNMCEAFRSGKDIHTATAAKVFNVDEADVTKEMRYKAKSVNFGLYTGKGHLDLPTTWASAEQRQRVSSTVIKRNLPASRNTWMIHQFRP